MKTEGVGHPPASPAASKSEGVKGKEGAKKDTFAKLIVPQETDPLPMPLPVFGTLPAMQEASQAAPVTTPKLMDNLVQEISTVIQTAPTGEVKIQFDSNTLGGLQVTVAKENGKLAIELTSRSAEVSKLLSQNAEALAQRLESRGYSGTSIQIRTVSASKSERRASSDQQRSGGQQQQSQGQKR